MDKFNETNITATQKPLLLWPGVIIVVIQFLVRYIAPVVLPNGLLIGISGNAWSSGHSSVVDLFQPGTAD